MASLMSCGPNPVFYQQVDDLATQGQPQQAYDLVVKSQMLYGRRERLLYHMDRGLLAHYAGDFAKSNEGFEDAEKAGEALYTRSITGQASSFLINDYMFAYRGEDFERVLVHLFMAINYAKTGKLEDALVEARKVDSKLRALNDSYPEDQKNIYREDAFVRFIAGVLFEMTGSFEDAAIEYEKSLEIYDDYARNYGTQAPAFVVESLFCAADASRSEDRWKEYKKKHGRVRYTPYEERKKLGEVIVVHYSGRSPVKISVNQPVPLEPTVILDMAIPRYERVPRVGGGARITLTGGDGKEFTGETELMEDLEAIAIKNLENRIARIYAKAVARLVTQYLVIKTQVEQIRQQYGDQTAASAAMLMSGLQKMASRADTRSCRLLPAEIRVARIQLPPGEYSLKAMRPGGQPVEGETRITLEANRKEFVVLRSYD